MRHAALPSSAGRQEGLVQVLVPLHGAVSKIQIFCSVLSMQLGARGALLLCVLWGWAGSTWQSQVSCAGCWWIWLNTAEFLQKLRFTGVMDPVRAGSLELSSDFWICWEMQAGLGHGGGSTEGAVLCLAANSWPEVLWPEHICSFEITPWNRGAVPHSQQPAPILGRIPAVLCEGALRWDEHSSVGAALSAPSSVWGSCPLLSRLSARLAPARLTLNSHIRACSRGCSCYCSHFPAPLGSSSSPEAAAG